jgi:hypothetical protein
MFGRWSLTVLLRCIVSHVSGHKSLLPAKQILTFAASRLDRRLLVLYSRLKCSGSEVDRARRVCEITWGILGDATVLDCREEEYTLFLKSHDERLGVTALPPLTQSFVLVLAHLIVIGVVLQLCSKSEVHYNFFMGK